MSPHLPQTCRRQQYWKSTGRQQRDDSNRDNTAACNNNNKSKKHEKRVLVQPLRKAKADATCSYLLRLRPASALGAVLRRLVRVAGFSGCGLAEAFDADVAVFAPAGAFGRSTQKSRQQAHRNRIPEQVNSRLPRHVTDSKLPGTW